MIRDGRSVAICGPLDSGQSALLDEVADCFSDSVVVDCSAANALETVLGFVESSSPPSVILAKDFDLVPELLEHLAGRAGLTKLVVGTSCRSRAQRLASRLEGEWSKVEIWPKSAGEISQNPDGLVETLFSPKPSLRTSTELGVSDYQAIIVSADRSHGFDLRIAAVVDYALKAKICDLAALDALVRLLTHHSNWLQRPVVLAELARTTAMTPEEVERGLNLACDLMLMVRMGSADSNRGIHGIGARTPFLFFSAMQHRMLAPISSPATSAHHGDQFNLDSFVVGEVVKQLSWLDGSTTMQSWQGNSGRHEALLLHRILPQRGRRTVVIRASLSGSASQADLECFEQARLTLGPAFWVGLLLVTGSEVTGLLDRIFAAPLDSLWCSKAPQVCTG